MIFQMMTPLTRFILLILIILVLSLRRSRVSIVFFIGACYFTMGQRVVLGQFDFTIYRILIVFGMIRIILRREFVIEYFNKIDKSIVLFCMSLIFTGLIQTQGFPGFVNRLGMIYDILGLYIIFRSLLKDNNDIKILLRFIVILFIPIVITMTIEQLTGKNPFYNLGGVPEMSQIRDDRIRAQGPFQHPILTGTIAATSLGFMIMIWFMDNRTRSDRFAAVVGAILCMIMIFMCASSGPILSLMAIFIGLVLWNKRHLMHRIRVAIVLGLIFLEIIMKDHVWYIAGKINIVGGSTGWHRAHLISQTFAHFKEWWLRGTNVTRHWMPTGVSWSPDHCDFTNQFLFIGAMQGILPMILFIFIIVNCFKLIGQLFKVLPYEKHFQLWMIGTILFCHLASFMSIAYFDQSIIFFYLLVAIVSIMYTNWVVESWATDEQE